MKTLYVSDLDGTLLGADSQVSEHSRRILADLSAEGALITVATARTPATVSRLLHGTGISVPAVVMTGAALWSPEKGYAEVNYMSPDDVDAVLSECAANGVHPFVYTMGADGVLDVYHAADGPLNHAEQTFYDERRYLELKRFHLRRALPAEARARTILLCALGRLEATDAAARSLTARTECAVQSYPDAIMREVGILEIFAPGVSKAAAIGRVKALTGADRVVAFGDNLNDLPMFAVADEAVAVANALPEVRAAANTVVGPNTADAVAMFIARDFMA